MDPLRAAAARRKRRAALPAPGAGVGAVAAELIAEAAGRPGLPPLARTARPLRAAPDGELEECMQGRTEAAQPYRSHVGS